MKQLQLMESIIPTNMTKPVLNTTQKARAEKNRLKALTLRESKLLPRLTTDISADCVVRVGGNALRDTGGGFLLDDEPAQIPVRALVEAPTPFDPPPPCRLCNEKFSASFLHTNFGHPACDACRDADPEHELVPRTEAKARYLLQDCDIDAREPPLLHVERRNPHRRGGVMRLYLAAQLAERARVVWGSDEGLEAERDRRRARGEATAAARYRRELTALRRRIRPPARGPPAACDHRYEETALGNDMYRGTCSLCKHEISYEKM